MLLKRLFLSKSNHSKEEIEIIRFILKSFGYKLTNVKIFEEALTHKSFSNIYRINLSNERLEFLGDSILDSIIADILYRKFPDADEGTLTKIKSKIVNRKSLSDIGETLKIREHLRFNKGRSINLNSLEGNALEALIGAIYLDGGYQACQKTIQYYILNKLIDFNKVLEEEIDFKSKLYIWSQKNRLSIQYILIKEELLDGVWNYEIQVEINKLNYGIGKANSKKMAEQLASKETLMLMGEM